MLGFKEFRNQGDLEFMPAHEGCDMCSFSANAMKAAKPSVILRMEL